VTGLRRGLVDEEPELRAEAARIACLVPAASALEVDLVSRLFEDSDWETRVEAARALGRLKLVGAYSALIGALDDRDGRVRLAVLVSLDQIDPEQTREHPRVEKATRDRSAQVAALAKRLRRGAPPTSAPRGPAPVRSAGQ
jgi:HEAT repeat protein